MKANHNKQEVECQTLLQCSPHILTQEEIATVESDAVCQTLVSCAPNTSNTELYPLLSYTDPDEIRKDAVSQLYLPRVRKLQFTLPEWHIDSMQVSREQLRKAKAKDDDNTSDEGTADGSATSEACDELQALREQGMGGSEEAEEEIKDVPNENISGHTAPKTICDEFIALGKEKEADQNVRHMSKESVRSSVDQEGLQIQSILKPYRDAESVRKKRRKAKISDADCQTDLMVAPHILLPFESAVVSCELSVQTSVTCLPTCSVSDILPQLRSYIVHEGRQAEPTSGDNKNNASVLDLLKGLIDQVDNSHQHMFDPGYRHPIVPRELTEFKQETLQPKLVTFNDDKVKQEPPGDVKYPVVKQEPASDVTHPVVKQEPPGDVTHTVVKQEPPGDVTHTVVKQEPPGDVTYPVVKQEPPDDVTHPVVKQEPPGDVTYPVVKQEPPGDVTHPVVKQEPPGDVTHPVVKQEPPGDDTYPVVKQESEQFDEIPTFRLHDIDLTPRFDETSDSQASVKEEIPSKDGLDENDSDLSVTGEYVHSNIIATYDLTEDDSSETLPKAEISKPVIKASKPTPDLIPKYNFNIFVNNFMAPLTDANQRLTDAAIRLNLKQSNQMQPDAKSSKQRTDDNVHIHQDISTNTPSHSGTRHVKQLSALDLVIKCTTVFSDHSERPQQSTANLSQQLRKSSEDALNQENLEEPCPSKLKCQLSNTRPCDSAEICQNSDYVLVVQVESSESESLIVIQCPSKTCRSIESVQPTTSNIRDDTRSCSECSVSLKETLLNEIKYPTTPSPENLAYSPNICDNVWLQNCPSRNVRVNSQIPTTDKSSHRENVQSSSIMKNKLPEEENIDHLCPCKYHVQGPSQEILPRTVPKINHEKRVAPQTIVSTTITITSNASKPKVIMSRPQIPTAPRLSELATPSKHISFHENDIEGSDHPFRVDDLLSKQDKQKSKQQISPSNMHHDIEGSDQLVRADDSLSKHVKQDSEEQISPSNMLCDGIEEGNYIEPYMEELADEYEFPPVNDEVVSLFLDENNKDNLVYNNSCTAGNIETYIVVGYAADGSAIDQISFAPSKSVPQLEANDSGRRDSDLPWNVVHLQPNVKISYVNKENSETDLYNEEEMQKESPPPLPLPTTNLMLFNQTCVDNEPYAKNLAKVFSVDERLRTVENEIEWDKIILSRPEKIRKVNKPKLEKEVNEVVSSKSLPCICKSGCVIPVRVHRNIDLLSSNRAPSGNEIACIPHGDSRSTIVILPPRSRHFMSTRFPVEPETCSSSTKTKNDPAGEPLKSIISEKELKTVTSKKSVTFTDPKTNNSKNRTKLVSSKSDSSFNPCTCEFEISKSGIPILKIPVVPVVKKSSSQKSRTSTPRSLTPVPTKEKIPDESKTHCDPCNKPLEVNSSVSTASLKAKPDRVFMAMSACETEFKPIKQALNNVQEKLRNLNMPELDCIFNKEPAYANTLPTGDREKFNISVGYKLDQSNQGSFKYNAMNSNGMNNQYNTFSGIGSSHVAPTLRYSHTTNTYPSHTSMPYHQTEVYHSYRAPEPSRYSRQHQNYYSLPDSDWCGTNYGNNIDFPSPAESIASKYSFRNFDQDDYNDEFRTNSYVPDYIPSQYSVYNAGHQENERKGRPKDKECPFDHHYNRDSRNVPDSFPYFDDDAESSYVYRKNYGNSDKHSHESSKSKKRCDCKKPHRTCSRINKKNQTRPTRSKTNVETTDSQCAFIDVIKSLFMNPDRKHSDKKTPRLTSKDIENLRVHMQFFSKKDKRKHNK